MKDVALLSGLTLCCSGLAMPSLKSFGLRLRAETEGGNAPMEACTLANSPSANASVQLASWVECSINGKHNTAADADPRTSSRTWLISIRILPVPCEWAVGSGLRFNFLVGPQGHLQRYTLRLRWLAAALSQLQRHTRPELCTFPAWCHQHSGCPQCQW